MIRLRHVIFPLYYASLYIYKHIRYPIIQVKKLIKDKSDFQQICYLADRHFLEPELLGQFVLKSGKAQMSVVDRWYV